MKCCSGENRTVKLICYNIAALGNAAVRQINKDYSAAKYNAAICILITTAALCNATNENACFIKIKVSSFWNKTPCPYTSLSRHNKIKIKILLHKETVTLGKAKLSHSLPLLCDL